MLAGVLITATEYSIAIVRHFWKQGDNISRVPFAEYGFSFHFRVKVVGVRTRHRTF